MYEIVELCNRNEPTREERRNFPYSTLFRIDEGSHWQHYLDFVSDLIEQGRIKPHNDMLWVIPPGQRVYDATVFTKYTPFTVDDIPDFNKNARYHTHCLDPDGVRLDQEGPLLVPVDHVVKRSRGTASGVLDYTPTKAMKDFNYFDVVELHQNRKGKKFSHSRWVQTRSTDRQMCLNEIARRHAEFPVFSTSMVWVIPPDHEIVDRRVFDQYHVGILTEQPDLLEKIVYTDAVSSTGVRIPRAGPFLIPATWLSRAHVGEDFIHLDEVPSQSYQSFPIIEMYVDRSEERNFIFSMRRGTDGFHWTHYLNDARDNKLQNLGEKMVWVIPPNQTVRNPGVFHDINQDYLLHNPDILDVRHHTDCYAKNGTRIKNAGPILISIENLLSGNKNLVEHNLKTVPTQHRGYPVELKNARRKSARAEYTWYVPEDNAWGDIDPNGMVDPNLIDPDLEIGFRVDTESQFGTLENYGPILVPCFYEETVKTSHWPTGMSALTRDPYDAVMLVFGETDWSKGLIKARRTIPTKVISDVEGIDKAHYAAAHACKTDYFWVIDADVEVDPEFDFQFRIPTTWEPAVYVWMSRNNVNGLVYGNGGIKLFHRESVLLHEEEQNGFDLDFTESMKEYGGLAIIDRCVATTVIDRTPFMAWKSGLREAYKLFWRQVQSNDPEAKERLRVWCTETNGSFNGNMARVGAMYAVENATIFTPTQINDYNWLRKKWIEKGYPVVADE